MNYLRINELIPSSFSTLNQLVELLQNNKQRKIEIRGQTDNVGNENNNQKLSEARAKSVYGFLIAKSVTSERLSFKGYGESMPVTSNETSAGQDQNRRVEFFVKE